MITSDDEIQIEPATAQIAGALPAAIDWIALGAVLITVVLWASAFVGIRAVADDLSPGPLAFGRLLVGSAALGAFALARRGPLLIVVLAGTFLR